MLHDALAHSGEALLFEPDGSRLTFTDLAQRVAQLGGLLADHSARRVVAVGPNNPAWIDAYYGVPRVGATLCFVNHRLSAGQIIDSIRSFRPDLVLAAPGIEVPNGPVTIRMGANYEAALAGARQVEAVPAGDADVAWELPTSGTTGRAKIVRLSHASIAAAIASTVEARPMIGDEVYLFPFPLCHVAGYNVVLFHHAGRPVVLVPGFDAPTVTSAINTHAVTHVSLAPTMLVALLDHLDGTGESTPSLRCITYGAAPITPALLRRAINRLRCDVAQGYGMTELSGNAVFLSPVDHRRGLTERPALLRAAGRPASTVQIRLLDDDGHDVEAGAAGEVAVRAPQVMVGYADDSDNAAAFIDGWLRTGDVGRFDEEGYLCLVDRRKDIIITGGENVASREVEELTAGHPDVAEVAVVGLPDDTWGEMVCAVVVLRPGASSTEEGLLAWGRAHIGGFKKPRRVVIASSLPKTASGKVDKVALRRSLHAS